MNIDWNKNKLIPVITQDYETKAVLILSYMNQEAYEKTLTTKDLYYYSRSRQMLWKKGETSGNTQILKRLSFDCDQDAILAEVIQKGPACHTGSQSCFFNTVYENDCDDMIISKLIKRIDERYKSPQEKSYTNYLFEKGREKILKKIGEEASEVIIASMANKKDEMIYELSDLMYHSLVLMRYEGIFLNDIFSELENRYKKD